MADIKMINNYNIKDETARNEIEAIKAQIPAADNIATKEDINEIHDALQSVDFNSFATKEELPSVEGLASEQYVDDTINQLGEALNTALESGELLASSQLCYNKEALLVDNLQLTSSNIMGKPGNPPFVILDSSGFITGDNVSYVLTLHMGGESQSTNGQIVTQYGITVVVFMDGAIQIYIGFGSDENGELIPDPSKATLIFYNLAEIPEGLSVSLSVYGPQPYVTQDILYNALGDIESLLGNI